ncbi:MAG: hypothetical protein GPJ52_16540 [Candidatus Heimdallarchaeota archaeon]|nr:hypothetical protein [Candidatus Heimdallarchaeota archaeon]
MLKKSQLKKSTSLIVSLLFLFMLTATIMIPLFVNGKEAITNTNFAANDDDGIDDDDEEENERSVTVEVDGTYAEIYSESETEIGETESENSFQVTIDASSGSLSIELEYEAEIEVGETESEVELEYEISFLQLIGYNDADADNIYDPAIDTAVETYNIGGFNNIQYTYDNDPNGELHTLSINTTDGKFGIIAYVTNRFVIVDDILITPTEVKFDIYINDFVGAFDRVALKTDLEFEGESEYEEETDDEELGFSEYESEIALSFNSYKGFFSWKEFATTDGVEHPVYYTHSF